MKRKTILRLLWIVLLAALLLALYAWYQYQRKPADMVGEKASVTCTAAELVHDYKTNEPLANTKYLGKVVEVSGSIASINETDGMLVLQSGDEMSNVSCQIADAHRAGMMNARQGTLVTVRGVCTGYLMDVQLTNAVMLIKK